MHRARVTEDFAFDGVRVQLVENTPIGNRLRNFQGGSDHLASLPPVAAMPNGPEFSLLLRADEARALWEELCRFYGGHPPTQTDREDLLVERQRVDKLTAAVIQTAIRRDGDAQ